MSSHCFSVVVMSRMCADCGKEEGEAEDVFA